MLPMRLYTNRGKKIEDAFENTHWGKMQLVWLCINSSRRFEETFENTQWRKDKQMQPVRLCICSGRQFEDTFEKAQWGKVKQMQPMWLCIFWGKHFEDSFENTQWGKVKQMQPVRLCILSNKQVWMTLVVVKVVRSARCSLLLIKCPPPISHYLVCCRFTMTWSVSDSQLSWVTIMGLFSFSAPPNDFQMLGCNLQREWKDLFMVCLYVCMCIWTGTISPRVQR